MKGEHDAIRGHIVFGVLGLYIGDACAESGKFATFSWHYGQGI